jgi:signal transduction histidine kinase
MRSPRAVVAVLSAVAIAAVVIVGELVDPGAAPVATIVLTAAIAVSFGAMGGVVLLGVPGHRVGRLMVAAGATACLCLVASSWAGWLPLAWLSQWSWWPPFGLVFLALLVFPDGRLPSRRWRLLAVLIAASALVASAALALAAIDHPRTLLTTINQPVTQRAHLLLRVAAGAVLVTVAGGVGVAGSLWVRWRRADGATRHQLACLLPAAMLFLLAFALDTLGLSGAWVVTAVVVPVGMTIAVLRHHLYGLDQVINRTIVWLVMSLLVIVGFVGIVALLRDAVMKGSSANASLVATGLIAVTFEPLRRRVQRGVDHLLYGDRDDPYKVLARLGDLLGRTVDPNAVLPLLTRTIASSLKVPYVAVRLDGPAGPRLLAEHGVTTAAVEYFDMLAHGDQVGRLLVATRTVDSHFTARERRLLRDIALHAAVATEATQLIRELQLSRKRLVVAREEERRRLRRDLHDGLGPTFAGMSMQLRAARKLLTGQTRVDEILAALAGDLQTCTAEVRQLVDQLRPAVLDNGLEAALRAECRRFDGATLCVELRVQENLDGLPAAIDVATYRIVGEALTNVSRHAMARTCQITVSRLDALTVQIVDDGIGIAAHDSRGVGLDSMRERAAELGGDFFVTEAIPSGTNIRVQLPITTMAQ